MTQNIRELPWKILITTHATSNYLLSQINKILSRQTIQIENKLCNRPASQGIASGILIIARKHSMRVLFGCYH